MSTFEPHEGTVNLKHTFKEAWERLKFKAGISLQTSTGTPFRAEATTTNRGDHKGEKTIRFYNRNQETARAYPCCWGHYYNCNRTRIGMYLKALDQNI
jgi:hypothetical protein